jgi:hypothetical protein
VIGVLFFFFDLVASRSDSRIKVKNRQHPAFVRGGISFSPQTRVATLPRGLYERRRKLARIAGR